MYGYSEDIQFAQTGSSEEIYSDADKYEYAVAYGKMIDGALEALLRENLFCHEFYVKLWEFIEQNTLLIEKKQKAFALYYIWIDARIPYFELEQGIKMDNEVYREKIERIDPLIKKARFILYAPMSQKTERASLILKLLDELHDEEGKAVLMAQVIGMIDRRNFAALEKRRRDEG